MRKLQLDTVVNRAAIAYGGTKSEAELREVRAAGASRHTPLAGVCWPAAAPRAERITNGPFPHSPPPLSTRARTRPQMAQRDPSGVIREAILEEASEEAQQAYTDAQSRAKDVEMLVRCACSSCKVVEGGASGDAATKAGPHHHHAAAATPTRQPPPPSSPLACRSLNEVAALFQDLAVLVQHQSEMLDSIEENVEVAGACALVRGVRACTRSVSVRLPGPPTPAPPQCPSRPALRRQVRQERQPGPARRDREPEEDAQVLLLPDGGCDHRRDLPRGRAGRRVWLRAHQDRVTGRARGGGHRGRCARGSSSRALLCAIRPLRMRLPDPTPWPWPCARSRCRRDIIAIDSQLGARGKK